MEKAIQILSEVAGVSSGGLEVAHRNLGNSLMDVIVFHYDFLLLYFPLVCMINDFPLQVVAGSSSVNILPSSDNLLATHEDFKWQ